MTAKGAVLAWLRESLRLDAIPPGKYRALRFHIGPDAKWNAADTTKLAAGLLFTIAW